MNDLEEKMKKLINYGQKVYGVDFRGQTYFIVESGRLQGGDRECQKDFHLFDEKGQVGYLYLAEMMLGKAEREYEKLDGVVEVPEDFFFLSDIEISEKGNRGKGIGSMLLNWATKEMLGISKNKESNIPLLFIRQNSEETFAFYGKWGAVPNQTVPDSKIGSSCYMRIDRPETKPEYDVKVLAEYEKPVIKEDRHH